jgi:hypothetical protein
VVINETPHQNLVVTTSVMHSKTGGLLGMALREKGDFLG